jgi:hypothetical protein
MLIFSPDMNLPITICLLGVLIIALETLIKNFTNKTVKKFRRKKANSSLQTLLHEVTQKICSSALEAVEFNGVAKGIASPNVPRLGPGWRYTGDGISFIITNDNPHILSIVYGEKRILIWAKKNRDALIWFFYDESRENILLDGDLADQADSLCFFAHRRHRRFQAKKIKENYRITRLLDPGTV